MNRRRLIVTGISAAAVAACSSGGALLGPSLVSQSKKLPLGGRSRAYALEVKYADTHFATGKTLRGRTYDGATVGPTMEIRPGDTLHVTMINKLPPNPPSSIERHQLVPQPQNMMDAMEPKPPGPLALARKINEMNNPHDFNTTNLHVHGIQTVPHLFKPVGTSNPSAPMIAIEPGQTFSYTFPVPDNHPSGLHWYHPHHHGSTDVQVSNGMAGLIVVRGPIDEVPEIKAAKEQFIVVQTLDVNYNEKTKVYEREYIAYRTPNNGGYALSTDFTMITITGRGKADGRGAIWAKNKPFDNPTYTPIEKLSIPMQPGEVLRLRFLNGTNYYTLPLVLPGFEVWAIEYDGVNLLEATKLDMSGKGTKVVNRKNLLTAPAMLTSAGNRVEFLIKAPSTPGTYTLSALKNHGLYFRDVPKLDFADFVVSGSPVTMGIPTKLPTPDREYPVITEKQIKVKRRFTFAEHFNRTDLLFGSAFTINNELYKEMDCQTAPEVNTYEEWVIENAHDEVHPFHLHENSFQVIAINGVAVNPVRVYDTFMVPPKTFGVNGSITFRVHFQTWYGKTVFHCHVLPHEDTGMMQNILMV